jgi:hypothetical protein
VAGEGKNGMFAGLPQGFVAGFFAEFMARMPFSPFQGLLKRQNGVASRLMLV